MAAIGRFAGRAGVARWALSAARWRVEVGLGDVLAAFALLGAAAWTLDLLAGALVDRLERPWDGMRLAPVFALCRGYPLYPEAGAGPSLGYTYGPVSVLAFLPVAAAPEPTTALLGAGALSLAWTFGPVLALLRRGVPPGPSRRVAVGVGLFGFAALTIRSGPLRYSAASPVHDSVALGLGLLACVPLLDRDGPEGRPLVRSATLAVLAVSAKQNAVFVLPALVLYVGRTRGRRAGARYAAGLAGGGLAAAALWAALFGARPLIHYLLRAQAALPIARDRASLAEMGRTLSRETFWPLGVLALAAGARALALRLAAALRARRGEASPTPRPVPWGLPLLVGVGDVPIAVLGALKYGGDLNSLSFSLYYLAAAAALALAGACASALGARSGTIRWAVPAIALVGIAGALDLTVAKPRPLSARPEDAARLVRRNPNRVAFDYLKRHPGTVYLPWNPLASLLAEGRFFTVEDAINHIPPPPGDGPAPDVRAFLPRDPEYVAYPPFSDWGGFAALRFFPGYAFQLRLDGLPGFGIYRRPARPGRPPALSGGAGRGDGRRSP